MARITISLVWPCPLSSECRYRRRTNTSLCGSQGEARDVMAERGLLGDRGPLGGACFPLRGIIGSPTAWSRTPCGRRCAAGLCPFLDPAARSHGLAAERERQQEEGLQRYRRGS